MQHLATGPNRQHLVVLDAQPDENNSAVPNGTRWRPGDPPLPPQRIVVDYVLGVEMCERNPQRYKPAELTDDEHRTLGRRDIPQPLR
jgi:hypothetical protein